MRFSILAMGIGPPSAIVDEKQTRQLSHFIAEHNVSCVCLYGCGNGSRNQIHDGTASNREHNIAQAVTRQLGALGLKYGFVWDWSNPDGPRSECGAAVLTQLPILAHISRSLNDGESFSKPDARKVVAARLGVSPEINVDVFSADISGNGGLARDRAGSLVRFMSESASLLEPVPSPPPRRRGRPPRHVPAERRADPARLVFLAGRFGAGRGETGAGLLRDAGFVDCHAVVGSDVGEVILEIGRGAGRDQSATQAVDAVFLRPALRPTDGMRIVDDASAQSHRVTGSFLGFEV